ncbi:MAG: transcriptional repressor [Clostridia bacterium]|nr:transcriptional repressor [Clostridia bacterium]
MKNYSRQREAILDVLRSTDTHPTANWIYGKVRERLPNISLGTVYRNLSALTEAGEILCINVGDDFLHYDGDVSSHIHLHCKTCGDITDIRLESDPLKSKALEIGFTPENPVYVLTGICKNCKC